MKPRNILLNLKKCNENNVATIKQVYNVMNTYQRTDNSITYNKVYKQIPSYFQYVDALHSQHDNSSTFKSSKPVKEKTPLIKFIPMLINFLQDYILTLLSCRRGGRWTLWLPCYCWFVGNGRGIMGYGTYELTQRAYSVSYWVHWSFLGWWSVWISKEFTPCWSVVDGR